MALNVGDRLGHYDVTALIGHGGMGEVYRARDTKLGRDVALKVLPDLFADDPELYYAVREGAPVGCTSTRPELTRIGSGTCDEEIWPFGEGVGVQSS